METLLFVLSVALLQSLVPVVRSQRVVCVDAITNTGICAGGNLGTFVGPTAVSQCCTTLNAIAAYDVDSELCIPCNVPTFSCFTTCGGQYISGGKLTSAGCCDAIEFGGVDAGAYVEDLTGFCFNCPSNIFTCLSGTTCPGIPTVTATSPSGCCSAGQSIFRDSSGTCFSCAIAATTFPSFVCVERADGASQECDGENLGVFTTTTDCCNTAGAGGFLIAGFNFCDECSPPIQCFSDLACGTEIGTQKNTPEECCNSFDDNGVEGVAYMQGDTCEDCAFITDVNECTDPLTPFICGNFAGIMCENTIGSYVCQCPNGFMLQQDPMTCLDIDECTPDPCDNGVCVDLVGSYTCNCDPGYMFNGATCIDINECTSAVPGNQHDCDLLTSTCDNQPGSFECVCNDGFEANVDGDCVDINECSDVPSLCSFGMCINELDGNFYSCDCGPGGNNNDGDESILMEGCVDIDECAETTNLCGVGSTCINIEEGQFYSCTCRPGTEPSGTASAGSLTCVDINECTAFPTICDPGTCVNILDGGFYDCICGAGLDQNGGAASTNMLSCEDINECETNTDLCGGGDNTCNNIDDGGFYECVCADGFESNELAASGLLLTCVDRDECDEFDTLCNPGTCTNIVNGGFYDCTCTDGFMENGGDASLLELGCEDIDECADDVNLCDPGTCNNLLSGGYYICDCSTPTGFEPNNLAASDGLLDCIDIDECVTGAHTCDATGVTASCENTEGSFTCACNNGYEDLVSGSCSNIDDCTDVPNICSFGTPATVCMDTDGGYTCDCPGGTEGNGGDASLQGLTCIDVNECDPDPDPCGFGTCTNEDIPTFYTCDCGAGGEPNGGDASISTLGCDDIDECANYPDPALCGANGACMNNVNGDFYSCDCDEGFEETGSASDGTLDCIDIDECEDDPDICGPTSTCVNILGGGFYSCMCAPGTTNNMNDPSDGSLTCEDVNECDDYPDPALCGVNGDCMNIDDGGFYSCDCDPGYAGEGPASTLDLRCIDANECSEDPDICGSKGICTNIPNGNGYSCECGPGTINNGDDPVARLLTCLDIDECDENSDLCGVYGDCDNVPNGGFYSCDCDDGFEPNGDPSEGELICVDIDECTEDLHNCHLDAHCVNTIGGFDCDCFEGFVGDGVEWCKAREPIPIFLWSLLRGSTGHDGYVGPKGEKGLPGHKGDMGEEGLQGILGDQGERGGQGIPGDMGGMGGKGEVGGMGDLGAKGMKGMDIASAGVVFTVWGRTDCPSTSGTSLLYQGRAATARRSDTGTGTNYLCLPDDPMFDPSASPDVTIQAYAAGVRYVTDNEPLADVDNTGMPCSVCYSTRAVQLMIPGRAVCPDPSANWRLEYNGYLMSSRDTPSETLTRLQSDSNFRNEYICVSANAVSASNSVIGSNEAEVYHVHLDCVTGASLGCSFSGQLTCAMCTFEIELP